MYQTSGTRLLSSDRERLLAAWALEVEDEEIQASSYATAGRTPTRHATTFDVDNGQMQSSSATHPGAVLHCTALQQQRPCVPGALVSASCPTTIPEYGSSPHGHMVFVPLWMQHARLDIVSSEIIIPVCPDYSQCVTGVTQLTSDNPTPQDLLHFMSNDQLVARVGVAPAQRY